MNDISDLRMLIRPATMKQFKVMMVVFAIASATGCYLFGAPPLMVAIFGGFWLLPLMGIGAVMKDVHLAVEAYDGNRSMGAQVKWIQYSESESDTYGAEADLGDQGRWLIHFNGTKQPFERGKKDLPAVVTVWLHPQTGEPRVLKAEKGYFYAKQVERLLR